jgi:dGTPase
VAEAKRVVQELFAGFSADPTLLPRDWSALCGGSDISTAAVVRDYIAGMTDRFALLEHAKITHIEISP